MRLGNRLRLYLQTMSYLRRDQLAHMMYRRIIRRSSKPHRALDRVQVRTGPQIDFLTGSGKGLDRLSFAVGDGLPQNCVDWHTNNLWQPLRYQPHYFDYLHDSARSSTWKRAIISDWIQNNALDSGDGWIAYAVSLRTVNWIKFFIGSAPAEIDQAWLVSLYGHALWLENNLELHILANHYLKNAKALVFAGLYFKGADADRWRRLGLKIFLSQLEEQFLSDGGHYERSPMYHAIALEDVLDVFGYLSAGVVPTAASTLEALRNQALASLDFMSAMLLPDATLPLFNDSAQDVGPSPAEIYAYARVTLGYEPACAPERLTVRALETSGYFIIRDGRNMLVIDCGPLGPEYQPGHGHNDCLSYELALGGERIVVDTGVFDYENNAQRRYARGTEAHNTVRIDGAEQSETWDVFRVARRARSIAPSLYLIGPGEARFTGAHDGFERSRAKAVHYRAVTYARGEWLFEDRVSGTGRHLIESRVHLHPRLAAHQTSDVVVITAPGGEPVAELRSKLKSAIRIERTQHYPTFGTTEPASVIVMSLETTLPALMTYTIVGRHTTAASLGFQQT